MAFALGSSAFSLRDSVESDHLVLGFESSTLGLELWLEFSAFRVRIRVRVCVFRVKV